MKHKLTEASNYKFCATCCLYDDELTTDCPGQPIIIKDEHGNELMSKVMTVTKQNIRNGEVDYRDGRWVNIVEFFAIA